MRVLVGLELGCASLMELDDLAASRGVIGQAVWGPGQLLRDLELRLGLGGDEATSPVRVAKWATRLARVAPLGRFYSASFEVDPLGTAKATLALRDRLLEAGWLGQSVPEGGPRLEALSELENLAELPLPTGRVDRLARVVTSLDACRGCLYDELLFVEPKEQWSLLWQSIFAALERNGTSFSLHRPRLPGASLDTDLGQVQRLLRTSPGERPFSCHEPMARERCVPSDELVLRGDGSFVLLTAETSWQAARATAAIAARFAAGQTVIVRDGDVSALEHAFLVQGLPTQGLRSTSPWRGAFQLLPLALELAFAPKDPCRVLELLTLSVSPFQGYSGWRLARALCESPGIGGREWQEAKLELAERGKPSSAEEQPAISQDSGPGSELLARIALWLEQPGADAAPGADKESLLAIVERVRSFILSRIATAPEDAPLLLAAKQANAVCDALKSDPRPALNQVEVRRLVQSVLASTSALGLSEEHAGRLSHVDRAGVLGVAHDNVIWWSFVDRGVAHDRLPWRQQELIALTRAGIVFPDPSRRLIERAKGLRRALLAATSRVILVAPRSERGESLVLHPLWDELSNRIDKLSLSSIRLDARELLNGRCERTLVPKPELRAASELALPGQRTEWVVGPETAEPLARASASSLTALLGCPLRWALQYRAHFADRLGSLPALHLLNGELGHRLLEVLYTEGALASPLPLLRDSAEVELDELIEQEGAILLRPGMGSECAQLKQQLVESMVELARSLQQAGLRIAGVEKPVAGSFREIKLEGRLDLLVVSEAGTPLIIDLKWGHSSYRDLLASGQALQLALYAFAHAQERSEKRPTEAIYFSLKQGRFFGLPCELLPSADLIVGPSLHTTWGNIERSLIKAERLVSRGRFPITGLRKSPPLLQLLDVPEETKDNYFALSPGESCKYCAYDALCGRRFEEHHVS